MSEKQKRSPLQVPLTLVSQVLTATIEAANRIREQGTDLAERAISKHPDWAEQTPKDPLVELANDLEKFPPDKE
jgi:hypothetical protein